MCYAIVNRPQNTPCQWLLRGILLILSKDDETLMRIIIADKSLHPQFDTINKTTREAFVFSHFIKLYKDTMKPELFALPDLQEGKDFLEELIDKFGIKEENSIIQ